MVEYKVGDLSQLISNDKGKALDDLFKATSRPITSEVLQSKNDSEEKSNPKKENTEKNVPKNVESSPDSQKFTHPSRKFQINNEEAYKTKERDLEKEKRTVFIGNLPSTITKKQLKNVFSTIGTIDAIRFRGAARPDLKTTKKQAIIQRNFHEKRHNIIAYIRYKDVKSVEKAQKLNATKIENHTIRVDVACKEGLPAIEQNKAIYVGNLGFATEEDEVLEHFKTCGEIVNVRIIRDSKTGLGKGFCYVNFKDSKSVATAVDIMNGTTLCGRSLRVSKSVSRPKKTLKFEEKNKKTAFVPNHKKGSKNTGESMVKKVKKKIIKPSFEGKTAADVSTAADEKKSNLQTLKKKSKKKISQGERKRKLIAKKLNHTKN